MTDITFVVCMLVTAALMANVTLKPMTYKKIIWGVYVVTGFTTLLILNVESVGESFAQISDFFSRIGIGNPRSWEIRSNLSDKNIIGSYYMTFFSTWVALIISSGYEHKAIQILRERDSLVNWTGVFLACGMLYVFFWLTLSFSKGLSLLYSSQLGILAHQYLTIHVIALFLGIHIRAVFSRSKAN